MVGFTLAHEYIGFLLLGAAATMFLYVWLAGFFGILIYRRVSKKRMVPRNAWGQVAAVALVVGLSCIPYEWWQFATVELVGSGPGASSQLGAAAAGDHRYLVRSFLSHGTQVDVRDSYNETALQHACREKQQSMAEYLVAQGANLDSAPACRSYEAFAKLMKPEIEPPDSGFPKIPDTTITVTTPDWREAPPHQK